MNNEPANNNRVLRERTPTKPRKSRSSGFSFFLVTLMILAIALVYVFAGDILFPTRDTGMVFPAEGEIVVTFLDVGQGSAVVIRSAENAVLIDGGEFRTRRVVLDYLHDARVTRLCYVIATHPHSDHIGALPAILRDFEIGRLIKPDFPHETDTYLNLLQAIYNNNVAMHFPYQGEQFNAGIIALTVVSQPVATGVSANNASIVARLHHGETAFLFTGDAEAAAESAMIASGQPLTACVLLVGHHGSNTSTTDAFLAAIAPTAAVIQSGVNNRHGHPHINVLTRLAAHNVTVFRTDELGTIRKITDGQRIFTG